MKEKILALLRGTDGYLSGQEICSVLGVSRTAVWKGVHALQDEGYEIEAVQNRGYRLVSAPDLLTEAELRSHLHTRWAGQSMEAYDHLSYSTSLRLRQLADEGAPHGAIVIADVQEGGRGRRGRSWMTPPPGAAIALSLLLRPDIPPAKASMMTLIAAMAVRDGVEAVTGIRPQIKWPNDLIVNGRKICGILTEMQMSLETESVQYLIVGIGVNVNYESFPEELAEKATSLKLETGSRVPRAPLVTESLAAFEDYYDIFISDQSLVRLKENYNSSLTGLGEEIRILAPEGTWTGISEGIDEDGGLCVRHEDGQIEVIRSGEVSVRGSHGYV